MKNKRIFNKHQSRCFLKKLSHLYRKSFIPHNKQNHIQFNMSFSMVTVEVITINITMFNTGFNLTFQK